MFTAKGSHDFTIDILLIPWRSGFCQEHEIAEAHVFVADNVTGVESSLNFPDSVLKRIPRAESQTLFDFVEAHTVIATVRILNGFNDGIRDDQLDRCGHLGQLEIETVVPDVEDLAADRCQWGVENKNHGLRKILHMDERAPLVPVINGNHPILTSFGSKQVDH